MDNFYRPGTWNVICDVCGEKCKSDEVRKRWDGLIVCDLDFEFDHPQKYLRVKEDCSSVPFVRPEPDDVFAESCDLIGLQPLAEWATAGCAVVGVISPLFMQHGISGVSGYAISGVALSGYWATQPGTHCYTDSVALPNFGFADCMIAETP